MLEEPVDEDEPVSKLECPEKSCNYSTGSLSSFQSHRLVHERKRLLRTATLKCPVCGDDDSNRHTPETVEEHLLEVHFEKSRTKCDLVESCSSSFHSLDELIHHYYDYHLVEVAKPSGLIRCDVPGCFYSTRHSSNMTQHLRVHNDERNYECSVCQQKFVLASHLKTHQARFLFGHLFS